KWRGRLVAGVSDPGRPVAAPSPEPGSATPATTRNYLADRLMPLMANESARCLEENVVASPEDADDGMILGTGFPAWRGGALRFAENFGIKNLVEEMEKLALANEKYAPCALLRQHSQKGTRFYDR